jgi:hypothetical protein
MWREDVMDAMVRRLISDVSDLLTEIDALAAERDKALAEVERLREALRTISRSFLMPDAREAVTAALDQPEEA